VDVKALTDAAGAWIEMQVTDTGSGIPMAIAARLGEPFARNSGVVGGNHGTGTGLGLAICKGIAAAHGGYLRVRSRENLGTTITTRLRADLVGPAEAAVKVQLVAEIEEA
jgi:two-component system cell cycle sensor histidine kinase PleC